MKNLNLLLVEEVQKFVKAKVPYQHRGTTSFGCDCTGMVIGALRCLGLFKTYTLRLYKEDWNLHAGADDHIKDELKKVAYEIPKQNMIPGDILLFVFARRPAHVGVFIDKGVFAHCYKDEGKCCYGIINNSPWTKRLIDVFRLDEKKVMRISNG